MTNLDELLRRAKSTMTSADVRELLRGVLAAPRGSHPDAWMQLVAEPLTPELQGALQALRRELEASYDDGLSASPAPAERVEALRKELAKRGLHGFIVPRADEYQNEYTPPAAQRLRWISGFSGSAGTVVVLRDKAAIFVDGRYTLQVRDEVDTARFEVRHLVDQPATEYIAAELGAGNKLGYDPWLHGCDEVTALTKACKEAGGELVATEGNPLDAVWTNRPAAPISRVTPHGVELSGKSSADKRAEIARQIAKKGADAALITACDSIAWLLGIRGEDLPSTPFALSVAVLGRDGRVDLFIDARKLTAAVREYLGADVRVRAPGELYAALDALAEKSASVMIDSALTPAVLVQRLRAGGAKLLREGDPCLSPKAQKNEVEIAGARSAHVRDGVAMARFLCWLAREAPSGKLDELTCSAELLRIRREGPLFRDESFEAISGAGPNGAIVHYRSSPRTNRKLDNPSIYLIDSGGQYLDGTTDITRTVAIGAPTAEQRDRFTRVLRGHIAIAMARFPAGTTGSQLDALARLPLWQLGLDYDHGTGHGVGSYLSVHEGPQRISKVPNRVALKPGMIISNEPGYYKTGGYGIRIENLVVVTPMPLEGDEREMLGFETLTLAPIDRALIEPKLMLPNEIAWIDAYHQRVHDILGALVPEDVKGWLAEATRAVG